MSDEEHQAVAGKAWLQRVHHDLCKRLLWPARDRRDLGGSVSPGELVVAVTDDEGNPSSAARLWQALRLAAPSSVPAQSLEAFGAALAEVVAAAARDDIEGVLALEHAFDVLARNVK